VLEYSREHLDWQFKRAGFTQYRVEYAQMHHSPTNPLHRPLAWSRPLTHPPART
jgi:hypothetical protein